MVDAAVALVASVTSAACIVVVPAILLWLLVILAAVLKPNTKGVVAPFITMVLPSVAVALILAVIKNNRWNQLPSAAKNPYCRCEVQQNW